MSENTRAALLAANTGREQSPEQKAKFSATRKGHLTSPETIAKIIATEKGRNAGIPKSEETKERMRIAQKARAKPMSAEQKAKLLAANIGRKQSPETIAKRVAKISGANGGNWKGGITPESMKIRSSKSYAEWRSLAFARDGFVCQKCGAHNGEGRSITLQVHHMDCFADFPEKRLDVDNGITLCKECHHRFHQQYGLKHNRGWQIDEFLDNGGATCGMDG